MYTIQKALGVALCFLSFFYVTAANAAERAIDINAVFSKEIFFSEAFGSQDASVSLTGSIVFDDADPSITLIPAGSNVISSGNVTATALTAIPESAIISATLSIGNASWDATDLINQVLSVNNVNVSYVVMIEGDLSSQANSAISLELQDFNLGDLRLSELICMSNLCSLANDGIANDYLVGSYGFISDISATVSEAEQEELTTAEKLAVLKNETRDLKLLAGVVLLTAAERALELNRIQIAKASMIAFIKLVDLQRNRKLTVQQADALKASAQEILAELQ